MTGILEFVFDNCARLALGGAAIWLASFAIPASLMPTTKLVCQVLGRLGVAVPLAIRIGVSLVLVFGVLGGGVGLFLVPVLGVPIVAVWVMYPVLVRLLPGDTDTPAQSPRKDADDSPRWPLPPPWR